MFRSHFVRAVLFLGCAALAQPQDVTQLVFDEIVVADVNAVRPTGNSFQHDNDNLTWTLDNGEFSYTATRLPLIPGSGTFTIRPPANLNGVLGGSFLAFSPAASFQIQNSNNGHLVTQSSLFGPGVYEDPCASLVKDANYSCKVSAIAAGSRNGAGYALISAELRVGFGAGSEYTFHLDFYFKFTSAARDQISFLNTNPAKGAKIFSGSPQVFLAITLVSLQTPTPTPVPCPVGFSMCGFVRLELQAPDGRVLAAVKFAVTSQNREPQARYVLLNTGDYGVDGIPTSVTSVFLVAKLLDQLGNKLAESEVLQFPVEPGPKVTLQILDDKYVPPADLHGVCGFFRTGLRPVDASLARLLFTGVSKDVRAKVSLAVNATELDGTLGSSFRVPVSDSAAPDVNVDLDIHTAHGHFIFDASRLDLYAVVETPSGQSFLSNPIAIPMECVAVQQKYFRGELTAGRPTKVSLPIAFQILPAIPSHSLYRCVSFDSEEEPCQLLSGSKGMLLDEFDVTPPFVIPGIMPDGTSFTLPTRETLVEYKIEEGEKFFAPPYDFRNYDVKTDLVAQIGAIINLIKGKLAVIAAQGTPQIRQSGQKGPLQIASARLPRARIAPRDASNGIADFIGLNYTWNFDAPGTRDGTFSADLTLSYDPSDLPDDPAFDLSRIEMISYDPATGVFERLPSTLDPATSSVTARVNGLAPEYSLAVFAPFSARGLVAPALPSGGPVGAGATVVNPDTTPVSLQFRTYAPDLLQNAVDLAPGQQLSGVLTDLLPPDATGVPWWSAYAGANTVGVQFATAGRGFDALDLQRTSTTYAIFPNVQGDDATTQFFIANKSPLDAEVTLSLYDSTGTLSASSSFRVVARSLEQFSADGSFPALTKPFAGYAVLTSDIGVYAAAVLQSPSGLAGSNPQNTPVDAANAVQLFAPYLGGEPGIDPLLSLVNLDTADALITLRAYQETGAPLAAPSVGVTVAPGRQYRARMSEAFPGAVLPKGSIVVESSSGLVFGELVVGGEASPKVNTVPLSRDPQASSVIPHFSNGNGFQSSLVVSSAGAAANAVVAAYASDGSLLGSARVRLSANGRSSPLLSQLIPQTAGAGPGYLRIDSDTPVVAYSEIIPADGDTAIVLAQPSPAGPVVSPPAGPVIALSPQVLDFGTVPQNSFKDLAVQVSNTGDAAATLMPSFDNPRFSLTPSNSDISLDPGASKSITVRFSPTDISSQTGTLTLSGGVQATLPLRGAGVGAPLTVSPSSLDFGTVNLGDKKEITVRVSSGSTVNLSVASSNARFTLSPSTFTVNANSFQDVTVRFTPNAAAAVSGALTFKLADASVPVNVTGAGAGAGSGGASILVVPSSLDFGSLATGQTKDLTVKVFNTDPGNRLNVTSIASSNANFSATPQSFAVDPNLASVTVTVRFAPTAGGPQTGMLTLASNDATSPSLTIAVTGAATVTPVNLTRTMVYHEIKRFTKLVRFGDVTEPAISSSGNRIAFVNAPGDETDARYNHILVINPDGSGQREIDLYKQNCGCTGLVDISADGNTVVSTDSVELRIATASGSTGGRLITNREIAWIRISPRGDRVFFIHRRGEASTSDPTTERGLYVINADGSGLKQIAGPKAVAALFGNTPDQIFPFSTNGWSLDVSADGNRLVFGVNTPGGERLLAVNGDGTGLRQLVGPVSHIDHAGISGDGTKVGYDVTLPSLPNELGAINFDGSGRKALANQVDSLAPTNLRIGLSSDGSKLLYGGGNRLYSTDGSGFVQLSVRGGVFGDDAGLLVDGTFGLASMNSSADRFVYSVADDAGIPQLATLDLNPAAMGEAPSVTAPALTLGSIALSGVNVSSVMATVNTANKVVRVNAAVLKGGLPDTNVNAPVMLDNGTSGDVIAGDGIYTGPIASDCCATLGARTVRVKAEVRDAGNRRHATAIEFGGLEVVAK